MKGNKTKNAFESIRLNLCERKQFKPNKLQNMQIRIIYNSTQIKCHKVTSTEFICHRVGRPRRTCLCKYL